MKDYQNKLLQKLRKIVRKYCRVACDEVRQQWGALDTIDGEAKITDKELEISQDTVARAICAYGQKAWIAEFGKGSLMDKTTEENPFLQDYLRNNPDFNWDRYAHGLAVVGRPYGYYSDLDGETHFSHGTLKGIPIETWYGQRLFTPIRGKHIIRNILRSDGVLITSMNEEIQAAIMDILCEIMSKFPKEIKLC